MTFPEEINKNWTVNPDLTMFEPIIMELGTEFIDICLNSRSDLRKQIYQTLYFFDKFQKQPRHFRFKAFLETCDPASYDTKKYLSSGSRVTAKTIRNSWEILKKTLEVYYYG